MGEKKNYIYLIYFCLITHMDSPNSPTAWNIDDKSDYLSVDLDGLKVTYTGKLYHLYIQEY